MATVVLLGQAVIDADDFSCCVLAEGRKEGPLGSTEIMAIQIMMKSGAMFPLRLPDGIPLTRSSEIIFLIQSAVDAAKLWNEGTSVANGEVTRILRLTHPDNKPVVTNSALYEP